MKDKLKQPLGNQSLNWRHIVWFLVVWMILIFIFRGFAPAPSTKEISYTDFKKKVDRGGVSQITIKGNQISGKFKPQNSDKDSQQSHSGNSSFLQFF
jgi:ATP-dependent Zn protease